MYRRGLSRQAGNVTPQHTGRLRRVYQRFVTAGTPIRASTGAISRPALDWDDAEMWLEGAVQNTWSIAQMQGQRSQTSAALVQEQVEAAAIEMDEDAADVSPDRPPEGPAASANDAGGEAVIEDDFAADAAGEIDAALHDPTEEGDSYDDGARRCGRLRTCPLFRPISARRLTVSSWRSCITGWLAGRR